MTVDLPKAVLAAGILLSSWAFPSWCQQAPYADKVRQAYGLNQQLVNGTQYINRHFRARGHPYFGDEDPVDGSVVLKGEEYKGVRIKYDIFSQQLELLYENLSGARNHIVLVGDHLDRFMYGAYSFARMDLGDGPRFYQVIDTDSFTVYVWWTRNLIPLRNDSYYIEEYSDEHRDYILEADGQIITFRNRKGFAGCFPEPVQKDIRRTLRKQHFAFRTAGPDEILVNMENVSGMLKGGSP
jgi:hypothetical protein